ncbi:flagellar basal-body rod modification protein FlgD [Gammaproteobacteria bacterium]
MNIPSNTTNATSAASKAQGTTSSLAKTLDTQTMGQTDFLRLLVTQVKNQDPTKPMDSTQFVSQLAQFSALAGVTDLNTTMKGVANNLQSSQLVQGASLVGHQVLAPGNIGELSSTAPLMGAVNLPASTSSVIIKIFDSAGTFVQSFDLGSQTAGSVPFSWDGFLSGGQKAPLGNYKVEASYLENNKPVGADTMMAARVNSVALDSSGLMLQVQNLGEVSLNAISMLM